MDKQEHADRLRQALADNPGARQQIADLADVSYRTVGNWSSRKKPTMPTAREREIIRSVVGPYDAAGDDVETAVERSSLIKWRRRAVIQEYERHLYEQRRAGESREEEAG